MTAAVVDLLVLAAQEAPEPEDVKAGWLGFAVWIGLVVAVVLLAFSFVKQLRKVDFEEKDPDAPASEGSENDDKRNGTSTPF
ncbi:MAG TPA: hypothetical protein VFY86_02605 [Nocardioides sp.]|nr:hypothetical protein [Nocardioides sp.]